MADDNFSPNNDSNLNEKNINDNSWNSWSRYIIEQVKNNLKKMEEMENEIYNMKIEQIEKSNEMREEHNEDINTIIKIISSLQFRSNVINFLLITTTTIIIAKLVEKMFISLISLF